MTDITRLDTRTKRNITILVIAQAVLGAQMPMLFVLAGLAGQSLASNPCWATLPISLIVFGSMTTAPWLSQLMQNYGRKAGFFVGITGGILGGVISAYGLYTASFPIFLLGSYFSGVYMSAHGFYRFAAADSTPDDFRPKAISYVMAGGLASAIIGPQLSKVVSDAFVIPFMGAYVAVVLINVFGAGLFLFLDIPKPPKPAVGETSGRSRLELLKTPRIAVAIICAMVSYALMNLVMTSTPLAVVGCGYTQDLAADIVMGHVIGMFLPSFFTGHLIARFGASKIVGLGLAILAFAGIVNLAGVELTNFFVGLILLGVGWNFGFIGATAMLTNAHTPQERGKVQGMNDFLVYGMVTLGSLASGSLMNCSGGTAVEGWIAVNIAMIPFLILAGGSLVWLMMHNKKA
ncbi:MAG: MFS transporter [Rhodobacteraceae bacterium]|nr:MAG: MFS transporter [Paracoccaceae bacterium]